MSAMARVPLARWPSIANDALGRAPACPDSERHEVNAVSVVQSLVTLAMLAAAQGGASQAQPAATPPPPPTASVSGTRYWSVIETYLSPEGTAARAARYRRRPGGSGDRTFNFDKIRMLDASFLLLAARSSIHRTRSEMRGATEEELARKFVENFDLCLQYYPLQADSDEDFEDILNAIQHLRGSKYLRVYLIRRCTPGLASGSLFASYLQENLKPRRRELMTILQKNIMYKDEDPMVADACMDTLFQLSEGDIARALAADPAVAAFEKETGRTFTPLMLKEEGAPAVSHETRVICDAALREISGTARFLAMRRTPDKCNSPYVRRRMGEQIERVCGAYPLSDKADLMALIAEEGNG